MNAEPEPKSAIPEPVRSAAAAVLDRKGVDLAVLSVEGICDFADFFLIASGTSDRHVAAIAESVEERLRREGVRPISLEGRREGKWVLMDYGDFIVHVFDVPRREFYRIERLWADAPRLEQQVAPDGAPGYS